MFGFEGKTEPNDPAAFKRLTDALRDGPDSEAWTQIMDELRSQTNHADYRTVLAIRNRLESAKPFPQTQPSEDFSRRFIAALAAEQSADQRRGWNSRIILAVTAAAALIAVSIAGIVVYSMLKDSDNRVIAMAPSSAPVAVQSSPRRMIQTATFVSSIPSGWVQVGTIPLKANHGLRPVNAVNPVNQYGGLVRVEPLPANKRFEIEFSFRHISGEDVIPEGFITDADDFTSLKPNGHELTWTIQNEQPHVQLSDAVAFADGEILAPARKAGICVYAKFHGGNVSVETALDGKSWTWKGAHGLAKNKPWHVGVRLYVRGTHQATEVFIGPVKVTAFN